MPEPLLTDTSWLREGLPVIRPRLALTTRIGDYIVRTARNRALPSATRS
jgi:hypothetical protein